MSTGTISNPWTKKVDTNEGGGDFELPPGGSYPAVLVAIIDLGTHPSSYNGKQSEKHKLFWVWELTGEHNSKGEPFFVGKDFTFSLGSKSKLRPFLEGWMNQKFADDEEVNIAQFVNQPCVVNLSAGVSGGGKKFVDVTSVSKPMKGLTVPPRSVEPILWSMEGWNVNDEPPIPEWVPRNFGRKIADEIKASKEWPLLTPF